MPSLPQPRTQRLTIIAQDPAVRVGKGKAARILRAIVEIPAEHLAAGPRGYRVHVIDYDASSDRQWLPCEYAANPLAGLVDPFRNRSDAELLGDPRFHQQNVYAIVMRVLAQFEFALGRRVSWSFGGHQLKVAPHAFADANAFYSKEDESLLFGYFVDPGHQPGKALPRAGNGIVFSCLSHDVVAHETTHALVDGLRRRYTDPSSPDQAAFHEGIADVVALLSIFSLKEVVVALLQGAVAGSRRVSASNITPDRLRQNALFTLADEMGSALNRVRGSALRHSADLERSDAWKKDEAYEEPHKRGEVLVAAMLNALIDIWAARIAGLRADAQGQMDVDRVAEEGQIAAASLLTMSIRALDYCPPVHLEFGDYLSALLTADLEIRPDDSVFSFRNRLRETFAAYGIKPTGRTKGAEPGIWGTAEQEAKGQLTYERTHFEPMQRDRDEVFRFVWENRQSLGLSEEAYTEMQSVRPCVRTGEDGFMLHETVAEYVQILRLMPDELARRGVSIPPASLLPRDLEVFLYGGGTLIFDERGRLKYHVHNSLQDRDGRINSRQIKRLKYLAKSGYFLLHGARSTAARASRPRAFGQMHLNRSLNRSLSPLQGWIDGDQPRGHTHAHETPHIAHAATAPADSEFDEADDGEN